MIPKSGNAFSDKIMRTLKPGDMRPENPQYNRLIRLWQRLPVSLTRLIGPPIVRGIP